MAETYPLPPTEDDVDMLHSSNAMPDNGAESFFSTPEPDNAGSLFEGADADEERAQQFIEDTALEPDATLLQPKVRSNKAKSYEKKMRGLFRFAFNVTAQNPKTVPDAATILLYGPSISEAMGDLAAETPWAAKAVDMLTEGTDNAAAALMMASVPFVLQLLRNHEQTAEIAPERSIKIPFTKRTVRIKFKFKLRRFRQFTNDPQQVTQTVFSNPNVRATLEKQGIRFQ